MNAVQKIEIETDRKSREWVDVYHALSDLYMYDGLEAYQIMERHDHNTRSVVGEYPQIADYLDL